ncbi:hypothetical protein [Microbacterium rhizophilus]|uniref:hypothetical protein n=1 Tax=Microbacterium rhizophilus TaxID=3138934 RepID=UPI0031EF8A23
MAPLLRRRRAGLIAALAVFLTLAGGGIASAYWAASATAPLQAKAATVGVTQAVYAPASGGTPLGTTYTTQNLRVGGAVTLANTGSRPTSAYSLTLSGTSTTPGFTGAIQVAAGTVGSVAACTSTAQLGALKTGSLSSGSFTYSGTTPLAERGGSVVLCVQTWITSGSVSTYGGATATLALQSQLTYSTGTGWQKSSETTSFDQKVAAASLGQTMTCSGNDPWHIQLSYPATNPQQGTKFRAYLARESSPTTRVEFPATSMNPWYTVLQFSQGNADLQAYVRAAGGGTGNTWVYVEEQVGGTGAWKPAGVGKIHILSANPVQGVVCGWQ